MQDKWKKQIAGKIESGDFEDWAAEMGLRLQQDAD